MISYSGEIVKLKDKPEHYQEGPWTYKRNGKYYMAFASTCCPEGIGYAMSDKPTGPWKTEGYIMRPTERTRGNHPGIIDYKGKSYVFGLNYDLIHLETFEHHERRSVSVAEMHYNPDGTLVGTLQLKTTGSMEQYQLQKCSIKKAEGIHDLVFRFSGTEKTDLLNWDYWEFR